MTPKQAAELIGCSPQHVRTLIRTGKLQATRVLTPDWGSGYIYDIQPVTAKLYKQAKLDHGGWPRGRSRKPGTN